MFTFCLSFRNMEFDVSRLPIKSTGKFSALVCDYLDAKPELEGLYKFRPDLSGIREAIKERNKFKINRLLLVSELQKQYATLDAEPIVAKQIQLLERENTFTICTAHQPNLFTGHLYFVYKILHAIKLANELNEIEKDYHFVPVFYMGSEDADLDELGTVVIEQREYKWQTDQKGAVGRMVVDDALLRLMDEIHGQLGVQPSGEEVADLLRKCYVKGQTIEQCTFRLVHELFGKYGLVIVLPDNPALKRSFIPVLERELMEQFSGNILTETIKRFPEGYPIQAEGREINLFYLTDDTRERIEAAEGGFMLSQSRTFNSKAEMQSLLNEHPERFSPNVILRPLFQEHIFPDVAFIGGGGELAYWLELKAIFESAGVFFPPLVLRNSFSIIVKRWSGKLREWKLSSEDLFLPLNELVDKLVSRASASRLALTAERSQLQDWFSGLEELAVAQDVTLKGHVAALEKMMEKKLDALEKKMRRAARKREQVLVGQVTAMQESLFPKGGLQERVDNIFPYLAQFGLGILDTVLEESVGLEQQFSLLMEK